MIKKYLLFLCLLALLWAAYTQFLIHFYENPEVKGSADVGIVLGAALWDDEPSPALRERLDYALHLYSKKHFKYFIVSGGLDNPKMKYTEAEGMKNYLVQHGVQENYILLEDKSTSTYENLLFSQHIMKQRQLSSAIIITHLFHAQRSKEIAAYLKFTPLTVSGTTSSMLDPTYNSIREMLAYTKWNLEKLGRKCGIWKK